MSTARSNVYKLHDPVMAKDPQFGAKGDGSTDDSAAIQAAIDFAQANNLETIVLGVGTFIVNAATLTISGANSGITIVGDPHASLQQGSQRPACTIRWTGGASPIFTVTSTFTRFRGFAIENTGTAICAFKVTSMSRLLLEKISSISGTSGPSVTAFSRSVVWFDKPATYTKIYDCEFVDPAPIVFELDGQATGSGFTTFHVDGCVFDNATDVSLISLSGASCDVLTFTRNTVNQDGDGVAIDLSGIVSTAYRVRAMDVSKNEWDFTTTTATVRAMDVVNVDVLTFRNNQIAQGGQCTAFMDVTDSYVVVEGNYWQSLNGPLCEYQDTTSVVIGGINRVKTGNAQRLVDDSSPGCLREETFGSNVYLHGERLPQHGISTFRITATSTAAFQILPAERGNSGGNDGYFTKGQQITVQLVNASTGTMGAVTWNAASFLLAGSTWTNPASGYNRSITFLCEEPGLFQELHRTGADVANTT